MVAGADTNAQSTTYGTPLCLAALKGRQDVVNYFLDNRAPVNDCSGLLGSPLHAACFYGSLPIVEALLEAGATKDTEAVICPRIMFSFESWTANVQLTGESSWENGINDEALKATLGPDPKAPFCKCQPSFVSCMRGHLDILKILFERGVDFDAPYRWSRDSSFRSGDDNMMKSCLHFALEEARVDMLQLLLKAGADTCHLNYYGETPIDTAARLRQAEAFGILKAAKLMPRQAESSTESGLSLAEHVVHPSDYRQDDIVIAVMGEVGAGKSSFIRLLSNAGIDVKFAGRCALKSVGLGVMLTEQ